MVFTPRPVRPVGRDGESDSRSGVAAAALSRMQGMGSQSPPRNLQAQPVRGGGKRMPPRLPGRQPAPGRGQPPVNHMTRNQALNWSQQNRNVRQDMPTVRVTRDGIIQLPYSEQWGQTQYDAVNQANAGLLGLKTAGDQQALEFQNAQRQAGLDYDTQKSQTLSSNAASGTAFSSQYGTAVANNARDYANQQGELHSRNTAFLQNQSLQRQAIANALSQQLGQGVRGISKEFDEKAGDLGYGRGAPTVVNDKVATKQQINKTYNQRNKSRSQIQKLRKGGVTPKEQQRIAKLRAGVKSLNKQIDAWDKERGGGK